MHRPAPDEPDRDGVASRRAHRAGRRAALKAIVAAPLIGGVARGDAPASAPRDDEAAPRRSAGDGERRARAAEALRRIFDEHEAWLRREFPERGLERGDRTHAHRVTDQSIAAIQRRNEELLERRALLATMSPDDLGTLDEEERLSREILLVQLDQQCAEFPFRTFLSPFTGPWGPHSRAAELHDRVRVESIEDLDAYVDRIEAMARTFADVDARLRLGSAEGRTPPAVAIRAIPAQLDALLGPAGDGLGGALAALLSPFDAAPAAVDPGAVAALRRRAEERSIPLLVSALSAHRALLVEEYLPRCRASIAASAWPDGAAWYAHRLAVHTTTALPPEAVHAIGLDEVARIRAEMLETIARTDFEARSPGSRRLDDEARFRAFVEMLRRDPRFYHVDERSLLVGYRDICKRVDGWLPRVFRALPRLPYGVRPIPRFMAATQTTAYYRPGDIRAGEPGWFFANTFRLDMRPTYEMVPLALHEAVPGHHLQIALAGELEGLPEFRRDARFDAFTEGWALHAERLGVDQGMYADPYDDFGRLLYEMWRACRLVVDTGLHAFGWPRERAIEYMLANTALSELNVANEVDRYIGWPGQACAYTIGELRIRAIRRAAEEALGARFDLRAFHEALLGSGALPLDVLEARMTRWIEACARSAS
ncbi:MAG TPA: DUF885 domain-containing protein [Phycisphaerales bacterium]|nr:DUF885 domain-containing protein [Phycisphaerales bacterium]HMP38295.1 DUF885 domain-containing protein [Phycisphaerales bacterium]